MERGVGGGSILRVVKPVCGKEARSWPGLPGLAVIAALLLPFDSRYIPMQSARAGSRKPPPTESCLAVSVAASISIPDQIFEEKGK